MEVGACVYDSLVTNKSVAFGRCALARNGLTAQNYVVLGLMTKYQELDGIDLCVCKYYYNPSIDYEHFVKPMDTNPLILLPTPERALVEYIKNEKWCDEGTLIEALKTYDFRDDRRNYELLYKVAEFFDLPSDTLDYWIKEAKEDTEV